MAEVPVSGWISVESSNVDAIQYDHAAHVLWVRFGGKIAHTKFRHGPSRPSKLQVYYYEGVPPHVYDEMRASSSKGRFVLYRLKPNYRVTGPL